MTQIVVDIDSTLYDFAVPMRQAFLDLALEHGDKEEYFRGGYQSWVEWRSPADVCGMDAFLEALARVHSPDVILAQPPFAHARDVLFDLSERYELVYVSNRADDTLDVTCEWLDQHDFPLAGNEVICTMADKMSLDAVRESQYIIDDRPKTLVEFVYNAGWKITGGERKGFGLLYEYNRALTDIPNVYLAPTWQGIRYYLERKGVLDGRSTSISR